MVRPATKSELPKTVYFEKVNGMIFCSGVYRKTWVYLLQNMCPAKLSVMKFLRKASLRPADQRLTCSWKKKSWSWSG